MYRWCISSPNNSRTALPGVPRVLLILLVAVAAGPAAQGSGTAFNNTAGSSTTYDPVATNNSWLQPLELAPTGVPTALFWSLSSATIEVDNTGAGQNYRLNYSFYGAVNLSPTSGAQVVNSDVLNNTTTNMATAEGDTTSQLTINLNGVKVAANTPVGFQLSVLNSAGTAYNTKVFPEFSGNGATPDVTVGTAYQYVYQDSLGLVTAGSSGPFEYQEQTIISPSGDSNMYILFSGNPSTPGPESWAVLAGGAGPLFGLLRARRRRLRRQESGL